MTDLSKRQLELPDPARPVYLVTAGASQQSGAVGCEEALGAAAAAIEASADSLTRFVHSCCYVPPAGDRGTDVHVHLGLEPLAAIDLPDGPAALWAATASVAGRVSSVVAVFGWDGDGAHCAVIAHRESAETLARRPLRLGLGIGAGEGAEPLAATHAAAFAGLTDAPALDDTPPGHERLGRVAANVRDSGGGALVWVLGSDERRKTALILRA